MRFARSLLALGVAVATAVALAGPAMASTVPVTVSPSSARPGQVVQVKATCKAKSATASSRAFGTITLHPSGAALVGFAKVRPVRSGTYRVSVVCANGRRGDSDLTVLRSRLPRGPAGTGGGSTSAAGAGPRTAPLATGIALLLAGSGLAALAARRWRRQRQPAGCAAR